MNQSLSWQELLHQSGLPAVRVPQATEAPFIPNNSCGAVRTVLAGGHLMSLVNHSSVTSMERLFRKTPLAGAFTATPSRPFQFELGAVLVPAQMVLVLLDYRFAIYEPSGIVPGDSEEMQDRRLSTSVGYELLFDEKRPDNVIYELTPSQPSLNTQMYQPYENPGIIPGEGPSPPSLATYDRLRAGSTRASTGSASATLPQRHRRDAQLAIPFTYIVNASQRVTMRTTIFEGIPVPVSFFEGELSGLFVPAVTMASFLKEITACKQD